MLGKHMKKTVAMVRECRRIQSEIDLLESEYSKAHNAMCRAAGPLTDLEWRECQRVVEKKNAE